MQKQLGQYPAILTEQAWSITYMFWNWPPDEGFIKGFEVVVSVKKKKKYKNSDKTKPKKYQAKTILRLRELVTTISEQ